MTIFQKLYSWSPSWSMINKLGVCLVPTRLSEDSHILSMFPYNTNHQQVTFGIHFKYNFPASSRKPHLLNSILPWASSDRKSPRYSSESKAWIWLSRCKDVLTTSHPKLGGWLENEGSGCCSSFTSCVLLRGWLVEDGCCC